MKLLPPSLFFIVALASMSLPACGDPCRDLSEKICSCQPTQSLRQACQQTVSTKAGQYKAPSHAIDEAQRSRCATLLPGCTCDALAAGRLTACGLAEEGP